MSIELRFRRGTTAQHSTFTGAQAEVTVDTTTNSLVVHDGVTVGGHPIASSGVVTAHIANTSNPHSVTKAQVGLGNADNTSDASKPISTATQTALDAKVDEDLSGYTDSGALDGTEVIFANKAGAKKSTVQKILDWIKTQTITWAAKQTISGDLEFSGGARRILGDFSNATVLSRAMLQTSVLNGATEVGMFPNGTGGSANINLYNSSTPGNASRMSLLCAATESSLRSGADGTGAFLPLTVYTNGTERSRWTTGGRFEQSGFTKLGESSPAIKVKKLTGTTAAVEGGSATVAHGLTVSKIVSIAPLVNSSRGGFGIRVPPGKQQLADEESYDMLVDPTNVFINLHATASANILSQAFTVFITYEE